MWNVLARGGLLTFVLLLGFLTGPTTHTRLLSLSFFWLGWRGGRGLYRGCWRGWVGRGGWKVHRALQPRSSSHSIAAHPKCRALKDALALTHAKVRHAAFSPPPPHDHPHTHGNAYHVCTTFSNTTTPPTCHQAALRAPMRTFSSHTKSKSCRQMQPFFRPNTLIIIIIVITTTTTTCTTVDTPPLNLSHHYYNTR